MLKVQTEHGHYKVQQNLLFFKGKLYIPCNFPFKNHLLEEFHSSPLGGHSGIHMTYGRLKENVFLEWNETRCG